MQLVKYGPKSGLSPTIGDPCPRCGVAFARGDFTTLVRTNAAGKYADEAVEVHWACATKRRGRGTGDRPGIVVARAKQR